MSLATDAGESIAVYYALESLSFGCTDDVHEGNILCEDVVYGEDITYFQILSEVCGEFRDLALRGGSCLFEVALESLAGVLFCGFVIGKLYSGITIFLYCTELRNNARTSLDNGAWNILSISTENGSHSDFLSN